MKTKLFSLVVLVAFAACTFAVNQANHSDKERLEALEKTVAAQQQELDKLRPLGEAFEVGPTYVLTRLDFQAAALISTSDIFAQENIYYVGDLIDFYP